MGLDYDGLNGPPPPPGVDRKKRDAGKARAEQLKARQRAFRSVVIDLANLVMNPGRPRRGWPESTVERVGLLAEDHAAVTAVMQKRKLLHEAPSPTAVVPIVVLSYHLARRLGKLTRRRRNQRAFIVDATLDVEAKLERWGNGEDFLPEQDQGCLGLQLGGRRRAARGRCGIRRQGVTRRTTCRPTDGTAGATKILLPQDSSFCTRPGESRD